MSSSPLLRRILKITGVLTIALAPSIGLARQLSQIAPTPTAYVHGTDFFTMVWSGSGDVTANLQAVDLLLPPVGGSTSGCEAADFAGFTPGRIALVQRGTCTFAAKALNAQAAGATGVLIMNEGNTPSREPAFEGTLGGPGVVIPVMGISFSLGNALASELGSGPVTMHMVVGGIVETLSPAKLWIGLKNSDSVGLRVDLMAQVLITTPGGVSDLIGAGILEDQATGSSGFRNALLKSIDLPGGGIEVLSGDTLRVTVFARRTCSGAGHNSGTVRLWYNGNLDDDGADRDAGSRFDASGALSGNFFLRSAFALATSAGASRQSADATVNSSSPCPVILGDPDRPYVEIGTWSMTIP